jgi:hypothetical protein
MKLKPGKLSPMQEAAKMAIVKESLSPVAALAKAGYANPKEEKDRFLGNPAVRDAIISEQQKELISWQILKVKCKRLLNRIVDLSLDEKDPEMLRAGLGAIHEVLGTIRHTDPSSLGDSAAAEDLKDEPIEELVKRIVDGGPPAAARLPEVETEQ